MKCDCNPNNYNICKIRLNILEIKRNIRWIIDNRDRYSLEVDEILSQSFDVLRNIGLECLTRKNS